MTSPTTQLYPNFPAFHLKWEKMRAVYLWTPGDCHIGRGGESTAGMGDAPLDNRGRNQYYPLRRVGQQLANVDTKSMAQVQRTLVKKRIHGTFQTVALQ